MRSTPPGWFTAALCIHAHEGAWNAIGYVHGVPTYGGGMQFLPSTWASAGGGDMTVWQIAKTTPKEQLYRSFLVWDRDAGRVGDRIGSWREWGTARRCGLR